MVIGNIAKRSASRIIMSEAKQYLFIVRHGDRWDYAHPDWKQTANRWGDPPLSNLGHQQARETGMFLDSVIAKTPEIAASDFKLLCSPFLRTIQTADGILSQFKHTSGDVSENVSICPENSIWELDPKGDGALHAFLPDLQERVCYFPRLETSHESLFTPSLPGKFLNGSFPCVYNFVSVPC